MTADLSLLFNLTAFTLFLKSQLLLVHGNVSRNTKFFYTSLSVLRLDNC
jgi:hypothetical protein